MLWLMYFTNSTGDASAEADKCIKELKEEGDRYKSVMWMRINIDLEGNQCQKYEVSSVPCIYAGKDRVFAYEEGMTHDEIKTGIRAAMDRFLNAGIL